MKYKIIIEDKSKAESFLNLFDGIDVIETYSTEPLDFKKSDNKKSRKISIIALIAGIIGFCGALLFIFWAKNDYIITAGGESTFRLEFAIPMAFIIAILFSAASAFIMFIGISRLPDWHDGEDVAANDFAFTIIFTSRFDIDECSRNKMELYGKLTEIAN